jgi:hypothetical protein
MSAGVPDSTRAWVQGTAGPAIVTACALVVLVAAVILRAEGDPLALAQLGTQYTQGDPEGTEGYDGQFVYYLAQNLDPGEVQILLDVPAYRYQRILLPVLARGLTLGDPDLLPWALAALGVLSQAMGTWVVAVLLNFYGARVWYALVYGLWAGFTLAVRLDLPEPLAFALVAAALLASLRGKIWLAGLLYGLALFAKEVTALFLAGQLLVLLLERRWREMLPLFVFAIVPFGLFQGWLWVVFGTPGIGSGGAYATAFEWLPFAGLVRIAAVDRVIFLIYLLVFGPSILLPALWGIRQGINLFIRGDHNLPGLLLFTNALIIPFIPFSTFREPGGLLRFSCGLILAMILAAAQKRNSRVLNYSYFMLALNVFLIE